MAISASDVWAVGDYYESRQPDVMRVLIEHWNGSQWEQVVAPSPGSIASFNGFGGTSASDLWAVGFYQGTGKLRNLVEHWDGNTWQIVGSPNPPGSKYHRLSDVDAMTPTDAWAVGSSDDGPQFLHWDGSHWTTMTAPTGPRLSLQALEVISATDIWATGSERRRALIEHFDGVQWTRAREHSPGQLDNILEDVEAAGPSSVWAVGELDSCCGHPQSLVEHWDGAAWDRFAAPSPGDTFLRMTGLSFSSPTDGWAVGGYRHGERQPKMLFEHWNGTDWTSFSRFDIE